MPPKGQNQRKNQPKRTPSANINDESSDEKVEPYHCKGKFVEDFDALCRQAQITFIVPVVPRPHPPGTPMPTSSAIDTKDKSAPKTAKGTAPKERDVPAQPTHNEIDNTETVHEDAQPKTYSIKENSEYFRPKIQIEMDNPEKQDTVTEILIRAWKIDRTTLDIFAQSFPTLERLSTLHFWHTGLTDDTLKQLASILPKCANLRTLILDANPLPFEHYEFLFTDDNSSIVNLSLRHCRITERGAALIGQGLGNERRQNKKLQTLNLAYNSLGDLGAEHIARGLKFNRTLLVLNLSSNDINDAGAQKLAEVLNKFPLTPDELVYRRKLLLHSSISDSLTSIQSARRNERRTSLNSSPTGIGRKKSGVTSTTMPAKGKTNAGATVGKADGKDAGKTAKKDDKTAKKGATIAETKPGKVAGSKQSNDKGSKTLNPKGSSALANARPGTQSEIDIDDKFIINDGIPLLDQNAELLNNDLVLPGNRCLLSLNLSKNRISESGVEHFLKAVQYQELFIKLNYSTRNSSTSSSSVVPNQGLLRLELQRNDFIPGECEAHEKLQNMLKIRRDPIFKSKENQDDGTTSGRDTVGTPHTRSRIGIRH